MGVSGLPRFPPGENPSRVGEAVAIARKTRGLRQEQAADRAAISVSLLSAGNACIGQDHRISWRLRNLEVDREAAGRLAGEWLEGREPPAIREACTPARQTSRPMRGRRTHRVYRHLVDEESRPGDFSAAEILYVRGDYHAEPGAYEKRIVADPADLDAWAGLSGAG